MAAASVLGGGDVTLLGDHLSQLKLDAGATSLLRGSLAFVVILHRAQARLELLASVLLLASLVLLLEHHASHGIFGFGDASFLASRALRLGSRPLRHGNLPLDPSVILLGNLLREFALGGFDRGVGGDASGVFFLLGATFLLVFGADDSLGVAAPSLLGGSHRRLLPSSLVFGELGEAFDFEVKGGASALLRLAERAVHEYEPLELSLRGAASLVLLASALRFGSHHLLERELGGGDLSLLRGALLSLLLRQRFVLSDGVLESLLGGRERVPLEVQGCLRGFRGGEAPGLEFAVEASETFQKRLVRVRGIAPACLLLGPSKPFLLGGADGSLARVRAPVVLGGDGSLLNRRRRLRGGARLDPAKVLLRALRLLFVEGVLQRLRGDGASLVLLEPAPALVLGGGLHRLLGGGSSGVFRLSAGFFRFGASHRVGVGGGAPGIFRGADALSLGGLALHVDVALPGRSLRLIAEPGLGDGEPLLLRLDVASPLVLLDALGDFSLRHALHLHVRLLPPLVLGEATLGFVVHRFLREGQRLGSALLFLFNLFAFDRRSGGGGSLRGEPSRLLLGELLLRSLLERELRGDGFGAPGVLLVAALRLGGGASLFVFVGGGSAFILRASSARFILRRLLHGGVGGFAACVLVADALLLGLLGALGVGGGARAPVIFGLDPPVLLLESSLHRRDGDGSALLLLV